MGEMGELVKTGELTRHLVGEMGESSKELTRSPMPTPAQCVQYAVERKPVISGWMNIKVVVPFKPVRRDALHYHLAWNGNRWSRSGELARLCQWYPEIAESLTAEMEAGHAAH